jgi:hypothetical protein
MFLVDILCALVHWYRLVPVRRGLKLIAGICLVSAPFDSVGTECLWLV